MHVNVIAAGVKFMAAGRSNIPDHRIDGHQLDFDHWHHVCHCKNELERDVRINNLFTLVHLSEGEGRPLCG